MEFWNQGGGGGGCGICIQDLEVKQQQGSCVEGGFCGINVEDKRWEVVTKAIDEVVVVVVVSKGASESYSLPRQDNRM